MFASLKENGNSLLREDTSNECPTISRTTSMKNYGYPSNQFHEDENDKKLVIIEQRLNRIERTLEKQAGITLKVVATLKTISKDSILIKEKHVQGDLHDIDIEGGFYFLIVMPLDG